MKKIKSVLVDGQGYYYAEEIEPSNYLGQSYFSNIHVSDNGRWIVCTDYNGKKVKQINLRYVIEINFE